MLKKISQLFQAAILVCVLSLSFIPAVTTKASTDYHAYMGIQTNTKLWIFRNAYDDSKYGYGTDAYKGLHTVSGTELTDYAGTFTDAELTTDGTYTVILDKPDFSTEVTMSQLFVSTDIPMCDKVKVTDVIVKIDGNTIYTFDKAILNPESYNYVQIMCLNIWNKDVKELFSAKLPFTKCEITFTISGLEEAAAAQTAYKDFSYSLFKDHAAITGYNGSETSVKLPAEIFGKAVTEISTDAFKELPIKEVTLPGTITKIGKNAFYKTKLTSITLPKAVTSVGDGAFASCSGLQKLTVAKGNTKYAVKDGVLFSKDLKTLVQYPAGKTDQSYNVPDSVTKIQGGAFDGCTKLTKLTISDKVTSIGAGAFTGCTRVTIYAPSGSMAYKAAVKAGIKVKKN